MRNYAENGELCGIMRRIGNCAISHSPHLNVASEKEKGGGEVEKRSRGGEVERNRLIRRRGEDGRTRRRQCKRLS